MFRRHRLTAGAIAALAGALSISASAADWQQVAVDDAENRYSLDASRILREGSLVKAFVRTEYASPREDEQTGTLIFAALDRLQVRCDERSFALESRSYISADGKEIPVVASDREALKFRPAAEGSMSATIVQRLCAQDRKR
jgi:hypothetical protein